MAVGGLPIVKIGASLIGLVALAIGSLIVYNGWLWRKRGTYVADARTSTAADLEPGLFKISGTARQAGSTVDVPPDDTDALAATFAVRTYKDGATTVSDGWRSQFETSESVPFRVEDDTGTVRVDPPAEATVDVDTETTFVGGSETPPRDVQRYLDRVAGDRDDLIPNGDPRRYATGGIEPGDDVVVVGEVQRADAGFDEEFVFESPPEADDFQISDKSIDDLTSGRQTAGLILYLVGGFFLLFGMMFTVVPWLAGSTIS